MTSTAMLVGWRALSLIAITSLFVFEEWVSTPTCKFTPSIDVDDGAVEFGEDTDELKVMMVADLLLLGPDSGYVNRFFRDYYMSKFFRWLVVEVLLLQNFPTLTNVFIPPSMWLMHFGNIYLKSFESLKPDLLLVLGDVSAKGSELTKSKWMSVLRQFYQVLGPFVSLPLHAILGDRDIGECGDLDMKKVGWISSKLPGLDRSGCGAFEIGNISFVSLNAAALLCGNNNLRFEVEKVIERESLEIQVETEGAAEVINSSTKFRDGDNDKFGWRESTLSSGSGPVLLLHFPLSQARNGHHDGIAAFKRTSNSLKEELNVRESRELVGAGPYNLLHTLSPNATEYIFQALKPRIIFSAHRHAFSESIHLDRIREVTVPTMSWNARDDPGFVVATFQKTGKAVSISYCSLARQSHILLVYISTVVLFCLICLKG